MIICNPRFTSRLKALSKLDKVDDTKIRANAVVLFAPAYLPLVKKSENTTPTLLIYSEYDEFIAPQTINSFINDQKQFAPHLLKNAGHFVYFPVCEKDIEICKDPQPINRNNIQTELVKEMVSFFDEQMAL